MLLQASKRVMMPSPYRHDLAPKPPTPLTRRVRRSFEVSFEMKLFILAVVMLIMGLALVWVEFKYFSPSVCPCHWDRSV